jgi:hypothetical protein
VLYPGKRDWWLAGLLSVIAAALLVGGGTLVGVALVSGPWLALVPGTILLLVGGMLLWALFGTNCEITEANLIVRSGPFRWKVPLDAIEEVVPLQHWYSGPPLEMNFGLAVHGISLRYRRKGGGLALPIRFAPEDRAAFLLELMERCPHLEVNDDGSLRRPADGAMTG